MLITKSKNEIRMYKRVTHERDPYDSRDEVTKDERADRRDKLEYFPTMWPNVKDDWLMVTLPLKLANDLDLVILVEPLPPKDMFAPLRSELRWDRDRRDPTEAGFEGSPPTPVTPDLIVATLRYEISVEGQGAAREGKREQGRNRKKRKWFGYLEPQNYRAMLIVSSTPDLTS